MIRDAFYYYEDYIKIIITLVGVLIFTGFMFSYGLGSESRYLGYLYGYYSYDVNESLDNGSITKTVNIRPLVGVIDGEDSDAYIKVNITNNNLSDASILSSIYTQGGTPTTQIVEAGQTKQLTFNIEDESIFTLSVLNIMFYGNIDNIIVNDFILYYPYSFEDVSITRFMQLLIACLIVVIIILYGHDMIKSILK